MIEDVFEDAQPLKSVEVKKKTGLADALASVCCQRWEIAEAAEVSVRRIWWSEAGRASTGRCETRFLRCPRSFSVTMLDVLTNRGKKKSLLDKEEAFDAYEETGAAESEEELQSQHGGSVLKASIRNVLWILLDS